MLHHLECYGLKARNCKKQVRSITDLLSRRTPRDFAEHCPEARGQVLQSYIVS
jgi:hypothetical protein